MKTAVEFYREELNALVSLRETKFKTEQEIFEQAKEMEKEREKSIFSIAYRMTPIEFGKEYCELEFEKFNKTFKQQEQ
jgi:tyrosyl-tRNA synthetase